MFSFDFGKGLEDIQVGANTVTVLQDQPVAAVIYGSSGQGGVEQVTASRGAPQAILVAVEPQDALMLKFYRDWGASLDFALRSPAAEGLFDVVPVDIEYLLERFQIRWRAKD